MFMALLILSTAILGFVSAMISTASDMPTAARWFFAMIAVLVWSVFIFLASMQ